MSPRNQNRWLRLLALGGRFIGTRTIVTQWFEELGRIRGFGLFCYHRHWVLLLTAEHRRNRLLWCGEGNHLDQELNQVIFSNEFQFCLGMHDGLTWVTPRHGERHDPQFVRERHVHNIMGVMVRGAITYGSRLPLVFIKGNMSARR